MSILRRKGRTKRQKKMPSKKTLLPNGKFVDTGAGILKRRMKRKTRKLKRERKRMSKRIDKARAKKNSK